MATIDAALAPSPHAPPSPPPLDDLFRIPPYPWQAVPKPRRISRYPTLYPPSSKPLGISISAVDPPPPTARHSDPAFIRQPAGAANRPSTPFFLVHQGVKQTRQTVRPALFSFNSTPARHTRQFFPSRFSDELELPPTVTLPRAKKALQPSVVRPTPPGLRMLVPLFVLSSCTCPVSLAIQQIGPHSAHPHPGQVE